MGHLKEKYTSAYFTGIDDSGRRVNYGLGVMYNSDNIREIDLAILDKINFEGLNVLELGYGRGELISYLSAKNISSYTGVDFAEPAYQIAKTKIPVNQRQVFSLYCCDAVEFLQNASYENIFDVIVAFDFVEHIPRVEFATILKLARKSLTDKSVFLINTPVYRYDNDVLADGLDSRNHDNAVDQADFIPETQGMHCNKYTVSSLQNQLTLEGFYPISEAHFFVKKTSSQAWSATESIEQSIPFAVRWSNARLFGFPLQTDFTPDILEYAYTTSVLNISNIDCADHRFRLLCSADTPCNEESPALYAAFQETIKRGDCVLDVGGYIGLSSLYFSKLVGSEGEVYCFEPNTSNLNRILNNISLNLPGAENIKVFNIALSNSSSTQDMLQSPEIDNGHSSTSQLLNGGRTAISHLELIDLGFSPASVRCITLDDFVVNNSIRPNFIKVDIEGAEVSFLEGAKETLKTFRPTLLIEIHNVFATSIIIPNLLSLGYSVEPLDSPWGNRTQLLFSPSKGESQFNHPLKHDTFVSHSVNKSVQQLASLQNDVVTIKSSIDSLALSVRALQDLAEFSALLRSEKYTSWSSIRRKIRKLLTSVSLKHS